MDELEAAMRRMSDDDRERVLEALARDDRAFFGLESESDNAKEELERTGGENQGDQIGDAPADPQRRDD